MATGPTHAKAHVSFPVKRITHLYALRNEGFKKKKEKEEALGDQTVRDKGTIKRGPIAAEAPQREVGCGSLRKPSFCFFSYFLLFFSGGVPDCIQSYEFVAGIILFYWVIFVSFFVSPLTIGKKPRQSLPQCRLSLGSEVAVPNVEIAVSFVVGPCNPVRAQRLSPFLRLSCFLFCVFTRSCSF